MILDLSECEINYEVGIDQDQVSNIAHIPTLPYLTKDKWVVIKTSKSPSVLSSELTEDHFLVILSLELNLTKMKYGWYHYRNL